MKYMKEVNICLVPTMSAIALWCKCVFFVLITRGWTSPLLCSWVMFLARLNCPNFFFIRGSGHLTRNPYRTICQVMILTQSHPEPMAYMRWYRYVINQPTDESFIPYPLYSWSLAYSSHLKQKVLYIASSTWNYQTLLIYSHHCPVRPDPPSDRSLFR